MAIFHVKPAQITNIPVIILFHRVGRGRVDTTHLLLGTLAITKTPTLRSNVVSKWGVAMAAAVVAMVILASAIALAALTLVIPLDVPTSITCKRWRNGDGKVLWQSLKLGLASLSWLLCLERHCSHVLRQQGNVLIQRLLVCRDCVDCCHQFLRNS